MLALYKGTGTPSALFAAGAANESGIQHMGRPNSPGTGLGPGPGLLPVTPKNSTPVRTEFNRATPNGIIRALLARHASVLICGAGYAMGVGMRRGMAGRGGCGFRGRYRWWSATPPYGGYVKTPEDLKNQAAYLENELKAVQKRMTELKNNSSE